MENWNVTIHQNRDGNGRWTSERGVYELELILGLNASRVEVAGLTEDSLLMSSFAFEAVLLLFAEAMWIMVKKTIWTLYEMDYSTLTIMNPTWKTLFLEIHFHSNLVVEKFYFLSRKIQGARSNIVSHTRRSRTAQAICGCPLWSAVYRLRGKLDWYEEYFEFGNLFQ